MKKKSRVNPSTPFYSSEPAVSRKKIASQPPVASGGLANSPNKIVPHSPARMSGIAGYVNKTRPVIKPSKISIPKLGTRMRFPQQGVRKGK